MTVVAVFGCEGAFRRKGGRRQALSQLYPPGPLSLYLRLFRAFPPDCTDLSPAPYLRYNSIAPVVE